MLPITTRDNIVDILNNQLSIPHVSTQKMDIVEKFPHASVYLTQMRSQQNTTRGGMLREQDIDIIIFRKVSHTQDIETLFCQDTDNLEQQIYNARKTTFSNLEKIYLTRSEMAFPEEGNATRGALTLTLTIQYSIKL